MPFKSDKQRAYLFSQKPEVARQIAYKQQGGPLSGEPEVRDEFLGQIVGDFKKAGKKIGGGLKKLGRTPEQRRKDKYEETRRKAKEHEERQRQQRERLEKDPTYQKLKKQGQGDLYKNKSPEELARLNEWRKARGLPLLGDDPSAVRSPAKQPPKETTLEEERERINRERKARGLEPYEYGGRHGAKGPLANSRQAERDAIIARNIGKGEDQFPANYDLQRQQTSAPADPSIKRDVGTTASWKRPRDRGGAPVPHTYAGAPGGSQVGSKAYTRGLLSYEDPHVLREAKKRMNKRISDLERRGIDVQHDYMSERERNMLYGTPKTEHGYSPGGWHAAARWTNRNDRGVPQGTKATSVNVPLTPSLGNEWVLNEEYAHSREQDRNKWGQEANFWERSNEQKLREAGLPSGVGPKRYLEEERAKAAATSLAGGRLSPDVEQDVRRRTLKSYEDSLGRYQRGIKGAGVEDRIPWYVSARDIEQARRQGVRDAQGYDRKASRRYFAEENPGRGSYNNRLGNRIAGALEYGNRFPGGHRSHRSGYADGGMVDEFSGYEEHLPEGPRLGTGPLAQTLADFTPGVSSIMDFKAAKDAYDQGDLGRAALKTGVGAIGFVPGLGPLASKGIEAGLTAAEVATDPMVQEQIKQGNLLGAGEASAPSAASLGSSALGLLAKGLI